MKSLNYHCETADATVIGTRIFPVLNFSFAWARIHGSGHRYEKSRAKTCTEGTRSDSQRNGAPTRDLPLRRQCEDVCLRYLRVSQTALSVDLY